MEFPDCFTIIHSMLIPISELKENIIQETNQNDEPKEKQKNDVWIEKSDLIGDVLEFRLDLDGMKERTENDSKHHNDRNDVSCSSLFLLFLLFLFFVFISFVFPFEDNSKTSFSNLFLFLNV